MVRCDYVDTLGAIAKNTPFVLVPRYPDSQACCQNPVSMTDHSIALAVSQQPGLKVIMIPHVGS
jgi:hypothetical protein